MREIGDAINYLVEEEISVSCMSEGNWKYFRKDFLNYLYDGRMHRPKIDLYTTKSRISRDLQHLISDIHTSFFGITGTGVFLHFLGIETFPEELFIESDLASCMIYYRRANGQENGANRVFWLEFSGDREKRRFFFTPPMSLSNAAMFGGERALNEKERIFHDLRVNRNIRGLNRNLILRIDTQWLNRLRGNEM